MMGIRCKVNLEWFILIWGEILRVTLFILSIILSFTLSRICIILLRRKLIRKYNLSLDISGVCFLFNIPNNKKKLFDEE